MHFCNILLNKKSKVTSIRLKDVPKIHWVSSKNVKINLWVLWRLDERDDVMLE